MRIALLADIHANREAFEAVLKRVEKIGVDRIVLLGDIVGYGPDPEFCTDKAAELVSAGAQAVVGNHDDAIKGGEIDMNSRARAAIEWTRTRLDSHHCAFLASLPESVREGDALFVHASARAPRMWEYIIGAAQAERSIRATDARITIVGHVHSPNLWRLNTSGLASGHIPLTGMEIPLARSQVWLAVMGAVGQPRDGNPAAAFGILDTVKSTLTYERVAYDHFAPARKIRAAGLPDELAARLQRGR